MTLEEKTIELQSQFPPLKIEQIIEILKNFKPDEEVINEVEETPTEENKEEGKPPAVVETGTTVTAETNEVSDPSDSGNGTSQLSPYALRNLDIIGQRAERTIAMNAAEDLRRSRKSLEEASGFVADFKSSSNVVNEVGVFKDKDGNVIDTSNVEIEEEKKIAELDRLNATEQQKFEVYEYYAGLRTDLEEKEIKKKADLEKLRKKQLVLTEIAQHKFIDLKIII